MASVLLLSKLAGRLGLDIWKLEFSLAESAQSHMCLRISEWKYGISIFIHTLQC